MNYIGSKHKLTDFIKESIVSVVGNDLSRYVFCDLFAGTGAIGKAFKKEVGSIISNDVEYYAYVLNRNYIKNTTPFEYEYLIDCLNCFDFPVQNEFIFNEYSKGGKANRLYFSGENGRRIDSARSLINKWGLYQQISEDQYFFLLCSLLESADKVANTASVYGAHLKKLKLSAQKPLIIKPALFKETPGKIHSVFNQDANEVVRSIAGDILYLDPPYNQRQYGANYHLLNTIAKYQLFEPQGVTGLPPGYYRSSYCQSKKVYDNLRDIIENAHFKYAFLSYNNEGLLAPDQIKEIFSAFGEYKVFEVSHFGFRADTEENREFRAGKGTTESLHCLIK